MKQISKPGNKLLKFLQFPLMRILLSFLLLAVLVLVTEMGRDAWTKHKNNLADFGLIWVAVVMISLAYYGFVRLVERRLVTELPSRNVIRELTIGIITVVPIFVITIGIMWAAGFYRVSGFNGWAVILPPLGVAIYHAVYEELLFRGILYRIMEESLGTWLALAISALVFGLSHLGNPNATVWGVAAVAIEAGITLAAAYAFNRSLWIPIGMHFAWNFTLGGIFGIAVSGNAAQGLLTSTIGGPAWLSGGEFGLEASVIVVGASLGVSTYFLWRAWQKGNIIQPFWKKSIYPKLTQAHPDGSRVRSGFDPH